MSQQAQPTSRGGHRLGLRIAVTLVAVFLVSGALGQLTLPLLEGPRGAARWRGFGLGWAQQQLAALPPAEREAALARMRPTFDVGLWIEGPDALTARLGAIPVEATPHGRPDESVLLLPLGDGTALVSGPMPPPPSGVGRLAVPIYVALTLAIAGTLLIARPIARRLGRLEAATRTLAAGDLSTRVDERSDDAIGQLAASFDAMAARLQALFREREQLLQAVSHELSTPLARMRFHLEALEALDGAPDGAAREQRLRALDAEITELDRLTVELTSWVDADGRAPDRAPVDVGALLRGLIDAEPEPRVPIALELSDGALVIHADARQLARALGNLLQNALRYARERVVIAARADASALRIEVRDDGPGIPAEHRQRVLEPFARVETSRSRRHGGMGLGLAITHRVAQAHGGALHIEAAPEGGACVCVTLPGAGEA